MVSWVLNYSLILGTNFPQWEWRRHKGIDEIYVCVISIGSPDTHIKCNTIHIYAPILKISRKWK